MTDNRSIADVELLKREKHLAAVPVTEKILSLQLFDMDGRSLYETAHQFPLEPYLPEWASRVFTDDASIHIDAMGLNVTEFTSRFTKSYIAGGHVIRANSLFHHYTKGEDGEWDALWREPPERFRPFIQIEPDFGGVYLCDEEGAVFTLATLFADIPEVLKIDAALYEDWQLIFEANAEHDPAIRQASQNKDWWFPFHEQGLVSSSKGRA